MGAEHGPDVAECEAGVSFFFVNKCRYAPSGVCFLGFFLVSKEGIEHGSRALLAVVVAPVMGFMFTVWDASFVNVGAEKVVTSFDGVCDYFVDGFAAGFDSFFADD